MNHEVDPRKAEECAHVILNCVTQTIDCLRNEVSTTSSQSCPLDAPPFKQFQERGIVGRIHEAVVAQRKTWKLEEGHEEWDAILSKDDVFKMFLQKILLPMIRSLTLSYQVLDALPQTPSPTSSTRNRRNRPEPPLGMLSIQHYTDIACLIELTVCLCILPQLDAHVLTPIEDRIRFHLPKSLVGRLPQSCRLWTCGQDDDLLLETSRALARLVSLERFRPMLLPRHIKDIYAGIFQYEHNTQMKTDALQDLFQDDILKAKAYQNLLMQGAKSPSWLRKRVGPLLTDLACTNLAAIVQVFVPLQQDEVSTMASQRLGRTLAPAGSKLGAQIRLLLQALFPTIENGQIPIRGQAIFQTIWAVILHWPSDLIRQELITRWDNALRHGGGDCVHRSIREMHSLCSSAPLGTSEPWKNVLRFLFPSIWYFLLRVASTESALQLRVKIEGKHLLYLLCQAAAVSEEECETPSGLAMLASAWVHGLALSDWDSKHFYQVDMKRSDGENSGPTLEYVTICNSSHDAKMSISKMIEDIQRRIDLMFEVCMAEAVPESLKGLPSVLFRLLLKVYLARQNSGQPVQWRYELVATVLIPDFCDKHSPEVLLFGGSSNEDAIGLLQSIRTILVCCAQRTTVEERFNGGTRNQIEISSKDDSKMLDWLLLFEKHENDENEHEDKLESPVIHSRDGRYNTLLAIGSIVLSLLIAILELGSKLRSSDEESMLQSFLPLLECLARGSDGEYISGVSEGNAGFADMSGYALALVASRSTSSSENEPKPQEESKSPREYFEAILQEAKADLESSQPPIRARGMVSLGRLARGYRGFLSEQSQERKLIVEVMGESREDSLEDHAIREILRLSMEALADDESYVYLAAVQTVVAVADLKPQKVLPIIASALVSESAYFGEEKVQISNEQRVKLGEALIFAIRRRAASADFVPLLVQQLLFGGPERVGAAMSSPARQFQQLYAKETNDYFVGVSDEFTQEKKEQWDEQDIRLKTGGPMFALEEDDIVRSLRVSTLAELAYVTAPSALAPYAKLLMRLVINSIRLEPSRVVRRSAAMLAKGLYGCLLREQEELQIEDHKTSAVPSSSLQLATAFATYDEELMFATLELQFAGNGSADGSAFDLATLARCREALTLRQESEEIRLAGRLLLAQQHEVSKLPQMLTAMVRRDASTIRVENDLLD